MSEPWLDDGDVTLYLGDALETVREMPDESVDCVVTSPPYWGLRDYGTGEWDGGTPDCDHLAPEMGGDGKSSGLNAKYKDDGQFADDSHSQRRRQQYRNECGKCGAHRVDRQMGLEPTPDLFVAGMVELFREIRRVLAPHGTCWVNLGDSYAAGGGFSPDSPSNSLEAQSARFRSPAAKTLKAHGEARKTGGRQAPAGLKPKDLCGIPWKVAFALQADGWWLRSDIIWAKPNPMPESVTDRPTKAHEYVFLLTKQPRYWFDTEAVREPHAEPWRGNGEREKNNWSAGGTVDSRGSKETVRQYNPAGRNVRSVWQIATQPYPEAHFATFPEGLARRCVLAGCPIRVCRVCGKPSERIVGGGGGEAYDKPVRMDGRPDGAERRKIGGGQKEFDSYVRPTTIGWSDCGHNNWRPGVTLDPFIGSGTTAKVARDHQRHAIGIDLNATYLELAARRLQQLSLLTGGAA